MKNNNPPKNVPGSRFQVSGKKGFTLIELLLFMGMVSILLLVLTQMFVSVLDLQKESTAVSAIQEDGAMILSRMMYDISRADSIVTPSSLGQQTTSLQITTGGINYTYSLNNNGNLELTDNVGTDQLNSFNSTVSNLTFTRLGNNIVGGKHTIRLAFRLTSKVRQAKGFEVKNFQTTIGIR